MDSKDSLHQNLKLVQRHIRRHLVNILKDYLIMTIEFLKTGSFSNDEISVKFRDYLN